LGLLNRRLLKGILEVTPNICCISTRIQSHIQKSFNLCTVFQTANTCLNISISTCPIATYISLDAIVEYMLLECPIRAPPPQMGRSDWTLLTTSVPPLASSDMYVATGHVQEYSVSGLFNEQTRGQKSRDTVPLT
jgi:hypothetical protein